MFRGIGEAPRGSDGSSELTSSVESTFWGVFCHSVRLPSSSSSFQRTDRFAALVCVFFGVKLTLFLPAAAFRRRGEPLVGEAGAAGASWTGGAREVRGGGMLTMLNLFLGLGGLAGLTGLGGIWSAGMLPSALTRQDAAVVQLSNILVSITRPFLIASDALSSMISSIEAINSN